MSKIHNLISKPFCKITPVYKTRNLPGMKTIFAQISVEKTDISLRLSLAWWHDFKNECNESWFSKNMRDLTQLKSKFQIQLSISNVLIFRIHSSSAV